MTSREGRESEVEGTALFRAFPVATKAKAKRRRDEEGDQGLGAGVRAPVGAVAVDSKVLCKGAGAECEDAAGSVGVLRVCVGVRVVQRCSVNDDRVRLPLAVRSRSALQRALSS